MWTKIKNKYKYHYAKNYLTKYDDLFDFLRPHLTKDSSKLNSKQKDFFLKNSNTEDSELPSSLDWNNFNNFESSNASLQSVEDVDDERETEDDFELVEDNIEKKSVDIEILCLSIKIAFYTQIPKNQQRKPLFHISKKN